MNKQLFFVLIFSFISSYGLAQDQTLTGFVENAEDNSPIPSVHVINLSQVIGVISDKKGKFEIPAKLNFLPWFQTNKS